MRAPKNLLLILIVISIGITIYSVLDYRIYLQDRESKSLNVGKEVITNITSEIEKVLVQIEERTRALADTVENNDIRGEDLLQLIENETHAIDQIIGVTVAYEPYLYRDTSRLFAPYYDKNAGKMLFLGQMYDYTDSSVTKWYTDVVQNGATWISPYYGQGDQAMICDFGVPFYWINDTTGEPYLAGTVTLTISLDDFTKMLNSLSLGKLAMAL